MTLRLLKAIAVLLCMAAVCTPSARAQARFDFDTTPGKLPKSVLPSHYALRLDLDPARDTFDGRAEITIRVREVVQAIVLNARDLDPARIELFQTGREPRVLRQATGPVEQSWSLAPDDAAPIVPGEYLLRIDYRGRVNTSGVGVFRAPYTVAGRAEAMLATQLESVDARNVFPGFDEPAFRAVFELTVRAPRALEVLSNMPRAAVRADGDARVHRFRPTPPMPSYLVAVSVGRYDALAGRAGGVPLRILTAPGKRAQARYAMQVTRRVVPYYNAYFGVPYALPKLDQLAVPSVRDGAMEDWGLISYTETSLLYDPARSDPGTRRAVFSVIAHEVAHQWFGDLVTAASWDEIWLNEAFASWLAAKTTARFNPQWQSTLDERVRLDETLAGDTGDATRAIRSGPVSDAAVFDVFDGITYNKGAAVLGMLEQWLGPEPFRRGLASYMRERRFSNATAGDLWHHLALGSGRDVATVAASWTDQPGLPLVEVASRCIGSRTEVTLSQRRLRDGTSPPPADAAPALWRIPVRLARGAEVSTVLLGEARQTVELPGCGSAALIANAGGVGYYRVKYDAASADALGAAFPRLRPADQVGLLSDTFALARSGELGLERWFALLAQIPKVPGPARATLFDLAGTGLDFLDDAMAGTPTQPLVRATGRRLFAPELARLGWTPRRSDDAQTVGLRGDLIERLARFDDEAVVAQVLERFDADASGRVPLPAALRAPVLRAAGMHADRARFDRLMAQLKAAGGEEDRWLYASALAGGRDEARARELLAATLNGTTTANIATALPGMVSERSPFGELAYAFTVEHWDALAQIAGDVMFTRFALLPQAAEHFSDPQRAARLIEDQRRKAGADGAVPAARAASRIAQLAAVRQRDEAALATLLQR